MTLLFWSAKTTLPCASKTPATGDPREADRLATPLPMPGVAPPPATVEMTSDPAPAAELAGTPISADPAMTEQVTATTPPSFNL
jgi:hypothetical protein